MISTGCDSLLHAIINNLIESALPPKAEKCNGVSPCAFFASAELQLTSADKHFFKILISSLFLFDFNCYLIVG